MYTCVCVLYVYRVYIVCAFGCVYVYIHYIHMFLEFMYSRYRKPCPHIHVLCKYTSYIEHSKSFCQNNCCDSRFCAGADLHFVL